MPKYINADQFLQKVQEHHYILRSFDNSKDFGMFDCGIKQIINEMSAADVVEVVRCKDCKHFVETGGTRGGCFLFQGMTNPKNDDFCSEGERKETE